MRLCLYYWKQFDVASRANLDRILDDKSRRLMSEFEW